MGEKTGESITKAEPLSGPVLGRYKALAKELGLWLSLGGFQETGPDEAHMYNCHVVIDAQGEIKAKYRKVGQDTLAPFLRPSEACFHRSHTLIHESSLSSTPLPSRSISLMSMSQAARSS